MDGMDARHHVTLARVAEEAGVSISTVSRALRGRGDMAPETRARILTTARALGHSQLGPRRGRPRRGTSMMIDLVSGQFHDPYADEVAAGAHIAASKLAYDLVLTTERDDPHDDWPMRIRARGSAGVILGLILPTASQLAVIQDAGIPVVLLDPRAEAKLPLTSVRTTDHAGGADAARHLVEQGARRFIVSGGAPTYRFGRARVEGFEEEVRALVPDAPLVRGLADWTAPVARRACTRALASLEGDGPIGVFAISDEMAAGVYRAAADAELAIPRDMMVVGFDDVRGARWLHPPLTTIRQPIREMAAAAVHALAGVADGTMAIDQVIELPTTLVVRGSTKSNVTA